MAFPEWARVRVLQHFGAVEIVPVMPERIIGEVTHLIATRPDGETIKMSFVQSAGKVYYCGHVAHSNQING